MFRQSFVALVASLVLFVPLTSNAAFTQKPGLEEHAPTDRVCVEKMRIALDQYVKLQPDERSGEINVVAWNDLMCTDPEWMGNVVVTIKNRDNKSLFGVFHVHFLPNGTFQSATSMNMEGKIWIEFHSPAEWQKEWCEFIRTVYPEDFARQCR